MSATKRQDLPLPEARRACSYALRALEIFSKLTVHEMIEAAAVLQTLVQCEIARRNASPLVTRELDAVSNETYISRY